MIKFIIKIQIVKNKMIKYQTIIVATLSGERQKMLTKDRSSLLKFGKLELVDKEIYFIAFNRRDT